MSNSENYRTIRLILRAPRGEPEVEEYANSNDWPRECIIPENPEDGILREVVWRVSSEVTLRYSTDDATGRPFIYFTAPWRNIGRGFVAHARENLDTITHRELLESYDSADESERRATALQELALGSPRELDDDSYERIAKALFDKDSVVRKAAVYATSYTPSPLYRPYLKRISRHDSAKDIRRDAKDMLRAYDDALI